MEGFTVVPTVIGFEYPRTTTPLTSYVGHLISEEPSRLSQVPNLKDWLDNKSEKSVVYLSMGSTFPLDKETVNFRRGYANQLQPPLVSKEK